MKFTIVMLLALAATIQATSHTDPWLEGTYVNVFAPSGMKLRAQPNQNSEVLDIVRYADQVKILNTFDYCDDHFDRIDWIDGHWILVDYEGVTGYLFDGYLSPLPFPSSEDEICSDGYSYAYTLGHYLDQHYPTTQVVDSSAYSLTYLLSNGSKVKRSVSDNYWTIEMQIDGMKISEILNLMRSMVPDRRTRSTFEKSLLFIENSRGEIDQIKVNLGDPVHIRKMPNGKILVKAKGYIGC
ncbi:MAG: SH3 domain-containing protein [Saprospiraceae bacterium]|nr:SH3 domain-containing protein [Saprospiraceae bacterium]